MTREVANDICAGCETLLSAYASSKQMSSYVELDELDELLSRERYDLCEVHTSLGGYVFRLPDLAKEYARWRALLPSDDSSKFPTKWTINK